MEAALSNEIALVCTAGCYSSVVYVLGCLLTEPCIRADTGAFFDAGIEGSTGSSGWSGRLWPLACLLSRGRVMVYRVECRPLFRTRLVCCPPSRQSKVRFGDRLPCRGPGLVSGCGKSLRNLRCRRALQSPQAWKHGLLLVADGHGGNCPPPPLKQFVRSPRSASARSGVVALNQRVLGVHCTRRACSQAA